jgi:phospholipid/cholesterol/gamma-HCH transport system substrate-binding protein
LNQSNRYALKLSNEIKAALIIFGGIFLFLIGFNFLNGTSLFKSENTHFAVYENVEGLQIGTKVTINGLAVGKVAGIDFLPNSAKILVSFTLRNDVSFSKNSAAELYEAGLIGGKSIAIIPVYDNAAKLKDGDTLRATIKPGLTDVVNQQIAPLQQKLESVLANADSLFIGVNEVLNKDGRNNLSVTLVELSGTVKNINAVATSLDNLLTKQKANLNTTLDNVAAISKNVNQLSDSLAQSNIKQSIRSFETTLGRLNTLLSDLEQGNGSMGKLLKDEKLYNNIEASTKEIELLIKDLKAHPKRYVHFSLFGKKEEPYQDQKNE